MTESTQVRKQKYERFKELFAVGRQRYLDAGGDPHRPSGSLHGNDYLTDEERQELIALGRELGGVKIIDGYVHTAGRSWKLPENSPLLNNQSASEVKSDS
ncbi:hypothetical protein [Argonema antarcticum]|uniref:hypothetical protein n=1 Tax=Argonema antarcticum TaxID=2942763 RepID=UPI0020136D61|nr:hypothetical protein [Argonema antarcticum]MCL1469774.1 hypothetical protein [Argonema antarcticum A004/B2]